MPESIPNRNSGLLTHNTPPSPTSTYVREAKPSEFPALASIYARAFARDPMMNWLGGVRALVPADHKGEDDNDARVRRTLAGLRHFMLVVVKLANSLGPVVVVVEKGGKGVDEGEEQERIVGGALWAKPGATMDPSPVALIRVSPWKSIRSWGFSAMKVCLYVCVYLQGAVQLRQDLPPPLVGADFIISVQKTMFDYTPKTDKIHDIAFAARGMNRLDSWHLLEIAIDPAYEGKGESQRLSA